jgi:hypothetical protein
MVRAIRARRKAGLRRKAVDSILGRPKRLVTLRRDGDDFVVAFYPEDLVVFRHNEAEPLRKMCAFLQWKIISDSSGSDDKTISTF